MLFLLFVLSGSEGVDCEVYSSTLLQLVNYRLVKACWQQAKVAAICSREAVTCLLTPVLARLVTTTYNKPANNARIMRDSSTMLQLVNCRHVTACLQQGCSNLLATSCYDLANDSIDSVYHDNFQQDCKQPVADLSLTNRNKTCKRIRISAC